MTSEISKERLDVLDYMVESYSMWGTQDVPVHYRELHDLLATARREAKLRKLVDAVSIEDDRIFCKDVCGKNWFDLRKELED